MLSRVLAPLAGSYFTYASTDRERVRPGPGACRDHAQALGDDSMNTPPEITGKTRVCGVIGDPVEHTVSPAMHNAAFSALGLDFVYLPFRVAKKDLAGAVQGMRALNIRGLNVTIPHKVEVMPLLDEIEPSARAIGAVNVIVNDKGLLKGCNTDAPGFLRTLKEHGIEVKGQTAVILGAGGASRAICFALASGGSGIDYIEQDAGQGHNMPPTLPKPPAIRSEAHAVKRKNLATALERGHIWSTPPAWVCRLNPARPW